MHRPNGNEIVTIRQRQQPHSQHSLQPLTVTQSQSANGGTHRDLHGQRRSRAVKQGELGHSFKDKKLHVHEQSAARGLSQ
jgi:hypothetical protein